MRATQVIEKHKLNRKIDIYTSYFNACLNWVARTKAGHDIGDYPSILEKSAT